MLPKVTLKAPPGVGGQIHASATQNVYTIGPDGTVVVDSPDIRDLIGAGYTIVQQEGDPDTETAAPITSDSLTADTKGATALDIADREASKPVATDTGPEQSHDFGGAMPPHGVDKSGPSNATEARHENAEQALADDAAKRAGAPDAGSETPLAKIVPHAKPASSTEGAPAPEAEPLAKTAT